MKAPLRRWFPKKLLQWREPLEFRRLVRLSQERTRSKWFRRKYALLFFAMLMGPYLGRWAVSDEPMEFPLWVASLLAVGFAGMTVYVLIPWLERLPSTVTMREPHFARAHGNAHSFWRFTDIHQCFWSHHPNFSVLILEMKTARPGQRVFIGVPAGELVAQVDAVLRERGVVPQVDDTAVRHHFQPASSE